MTLLTKRLVLRSLALMLCAAPAAAPVMLPGTALAEPGGCLKYGAAGAVGGHLVHHGVLGAAGGCATGMYKRHQYRKQQRAAQAQQMQGAGDGGAGR